MSLSWIFRPLTLAALALGLLTLAVRADAIFADFVTSKGSFTCQLDYTNAPKAVANFIGLATGQRAWLDTTTGRVKTNNFYTNVAFHRVIDKFMIQGGSPNGQGNDGPGYSFEDEFTPLLLHNAPGVLSMANSGPDSNGAQYFVTVTNTPWLDGVHTVFGRVTSGMNVVYAISQVATNASSKPLTNVVVQQINIRRVGTAADAFNIYNQGLPVVTNLPLQIAKNTGLATLTFSNLLYAKNQLYYSTNLTSWTADPSGIQVATPIYNSTNVVTSAARQFYTMAQIQYGNSPLAPQSINSKTLILTETNGEIGTLTLAFNAGGGGTFNFSPNYNGVIYGSSWKPYWGSLIMGLSLFTAPERKINLNFTTPTNGTFRGFTYYSYPDAIAYIISGTFVLPNP